MFASVIDMLTRNAENERVFLHLWERSTVKHEYSYHDIYNGAMKYAAYLKENGLKQGDRAAILLLTRIEYFFVFFGVILAGGIPIPIHPPIFILEWEDYKQKFLHIMDKSHPKFLICYEDIFNAVSTKLLNDVYKEINIIQFEEIEKSSLSSETAIQVTENDTVYIQYTSGSTALPKGCIISNAALMNNIRAIGNKLQLTDKDTVVSWLPLYHDMGLVGCFLTAFYFGLKICLIPTEYFIMQPTIYFRIITEYKATFICAPNFGYVICNKYVNFKKMVDIDLHTIRVSLIGAEHIENSDLAEFILKFGVYGFNENTFLPVYGFAESCLAVSFPELNESVKLDRIDWDLLNKENKAVSTTRTDCKTLEIISVGKSVGGHIKIVNEHGKEVPEGVLGEICVKSDMIIKEYDNYENINMYAEDGYFLTGDIGYMKEDALFFFERKQNMIRRDHYLYRVKEFEQLCWDIPEIKKGRSVLLGIPAKSEESNSYLELLVETGTYYKEKYIEIIKKMNAAFLSKIGQIPDYIRIVARGCIPETSSGKRQHYLCKDKIKSNTIDTFFLYDNLNDIVLFSK